MSQLKTKARFDRDTNTIQYPAETMNYWYGRKYIDTFDRYQSAWDVYGTMTMNRDSKFVVNELEASPLMWQSHNSCSWDPQGGVTHGKIELEPNKIKVNLEQCYDEFFDSCFKHYLQWSGSSVEYGPVGDRLMSLAMDNILKSAAAGYRGLLVGGQLYGSDVTDGNITFETDTPTSIQAWFNDQHNSAEGWLGLAAQTALSNPTKFEHMNIPDLITEDDCDDNGRYSGSFVGLTDSILAQANQKLLQVVDEGGIDDAGVILSPIWIVSPGVYRSMVQEFHTYEAQPLANQMPITRERIGTGRGAYYQYYKENVPIVPERYGNFFDKYVNANTHFAYLTTSRNIQFGTNFARIPNSATGAGISAVVKGYGLEQPSKHGLYEVLIHSLIKVFISDSDYMCGTQEVIVPS